jgi:hypothetical protein
VESVSGGVVLWNLYWEMCSGFCVWRHSTVNSVSGDTVLWILYREMYSGFCVWRHSTVNSVSGDIQWVLCLEA